MEWRCDDVEWRCDDVELKVNFNMNIKTICLVLAFSAAGFTQSAGVTTVVVTYNATPTFTVNSGVTNFEMTLTGNVTSSTFASAAAAVGSFKICQDGTGGRTFAWPASFQGFGAIDPTASACSKVSWKWDGTYVCATGPVISDGTGGYVSFNPSGSGKVAGAFSASSFNTSDTTHNGVQYLQGTTSGGLAWAVTSIAGTPVTILYPTDTSTATTGSALAVGAVVTCPLGLPSLAPTPCRSSSWARTQWSCQPGIGDGLNAIAAGTYLESTCYNDTGSTVTLTGIKCFTDNSGTSALSVTNGAGTALLTGAVTCLSSFAAGTQSGTTTLATGDFLKFSFVSDGTSKQSTWAVTGSR